MWTVKLPEIVKKIDQYKSYYRKHYKRDIFITNLLVFFLFKQNFPIYKFFPVFTPTDLDCQ